MLIIMLISGFKLGYSLIQIHSFIHLTSFKDNKKYRKIKVYYRTNLKISENEFISNYAWEWILELI